MSRGWSVPLSLLLTSLALSGCMGADTTEADPVPVEPDECVGMETAQFCSGAVIDEATGRDLRFDLLATDKLDAPVWQVGDIFEQHVYYGTRDGSGEHIVTMVVDDAAQDADGEDCYRFGTTSKNAATTEVVYDLPILGCVGKEHLATTAFNVDWSWMYDFPLEDNKTWPGQVQGLFNWNQNSFHHFEFNLTARYHPAINTPTGNYPGFEIEGMTGDGELLLVYNYVPVVGWFSHFWMYDITTDVSDDIMFHAMSMGTGTGYVGPYYLNEATTAVETFFHPLGTPLNLVLNGADPVRSGNAVFRFNVPADHDYLRGVVVPIACPGTSRVVLVEPDNAMTQHEHNFNGDPSQCVPGQGDGNPDPASYSVSWWDGPAKAGDWTVTVAGAGVYGYYIALTAVDEVEYSLAGAAGPAA